MIIIDLLYNLAVLIALSVLSGFIDLRFNRSKITGKTFQGLLFGLTAIIGMLYPFNLTQGIIFDGRSIVISLCTLFFGPVSGVIASLLAIIFRLFLGGAGAPTGVLVIISSFLIGLIFHFRKIKNPDQTFTNLQFYIFGLIVNGVMLILFYSLPYQDKLSFYKIITPTILGVYPFATLLIGKILLDQEEKRNFVNRLKEREELFRTTLYSIGDGVITTDLNGKIRHMNYVAENLTGWSEEEARSNDIQTVFNIINENNRNKVDSPVSKVLREGVIVGLANHTLLISKNGKEISISDSGSPIKDESGNTLGVVLVFSDQTETRKSQKVIRNLNRLYGMLSQSNQAIVRLKNREELLTEVCKIATNYGGFEITCLALYDQKIGKLVPKYWSGENAEEFSTNILLNAIDNYQGLMPLVNSFNKDELIVVNNLQTSFNENKWYQILLMQGFNSVAALPIRFYNQVIGVLTLYSAEKDFFNDDIIKLLNEVGIDISFALENYDREDRQKVIEHEKSLLTDTIERSINELYIFDASTFKFIYVNSCAINNLGYSISEFQKMTPLDIVIGLNKDEFTSITNLLLNKEEELIQFESIHKRKNGSEYPIEVRLQLIERDDNKIFLAVIQDISERKQAADAVSKSEKQFQEIFNSTNEAIFIQSVETARILDCNDRTVNLYGYESKSELIGLNVIELTSQLNIFTESRIAELVDGALNYGPQTFEWLAKKKNGEQFWVEVSLKKSEIGGEDLLLAVVRDISERKRSEEELLAAKERMQLLVEGTPHLFFYIQDNNLDISYISPSVYKITGRTVEEWIGQKHWFVTDSPVNEEAKRRTRETVRGVILNDPTYIEIKHANGNPILLEAYERPIVKDGKVVGIQGVAHDITEKTRIETQIKLLSRAIDQSYVSVHITDIYGNVEYVNPQFTKVTGYSSAEVFGKNASILKSGHHDSDFYKNMWETILSGKDFKSEMLNKKKNGELFWENVIISPIVEPDGKINHFVAVSEDITEKKKIIEDLIAAKQKAEEMNRIKSYFFATMSHELRTPFVGIQGFAELLFDSVKTEEEKEFVNGIISSSERLTDTLNKILSLSKIEFEELEILHNEILLNQFLEEIIKPFQSAAKQKNLGFTTHLPPQELIIKSDEKILSGILNNLLNNAIKYTDKGKIEFSAYLLKEENKNILKMSVSDTGIGISENHQDQIWLAFRQVSEGLNRTFEGTGLGLTITRKYVESLGGKITLNSKLGAGSTFTIELPVDIIKLHTLEKQNNILLNDNNLKENKMELSKNILYVEDDPYAQEIVTRVLSNTYLINIADNSEKALMKLEENDYDLVLIDINLGMDMDGLKLMNLIRKNPKYFNKPIVAVTAYASTNDREEFLSKGFSHYISKPFKLQDLRNLVAEIFEPAN